MKKLSVAIGVVLTMLAFSAGMIFGVFGFEQVAEFVGIEKGAQSGLVSGLHLHSADTREASTKIAAVDSQGNGLLSEISVEIEPGDGDVFYRVQPYAQVDLQYSAETAAEVAARLTGTNPNNVDVSFSIDAPAEEAGMSLFLVPYGQSKVVTYQINTDARGNDRTQRRQVHHKRH